MTTDRHACGLTSFLPMSCRGRAEAFARRLQSRLQSLGRQPSDDLHDSEESWLTTSQQPFPTSRQPRLSSSSESDIYFDFDCDFGSPESPQEEATETIHLNKRECGCILETTQDLESGCATASATATATSPGSSESSDNYYDPETPLPDDLAALIDSTLERNCSHVQCIGYEPTCLDCGAGTACFPQPDDCTLNGYPESRSNESASSSTEPGTATNENETLKTLASPIELDAVDNAGLRHHCKRLRKPRVDYTKCNGLRHETSLPPTETYEEKSKAHREVAVTHEVDAKAHGEVALTHEIDAKAHGEVALTYDLHGKAHEEEAPTHEIEKEALEMEASTHDPDTETEEPEEETVESETAAYETEVKVNEAEVNKNETETNIPESEEVTHDEEAKAEDEDADSESLESPLSPTGHVYRKSMKLVQSTEECCDDTFLSSLNILKQEMLVECPTAATSAVPDVEITEASPAAADAASATQAGHQDATSRLDVDDDSEDIEERPQRVRRCSSLKTGKTPPGTPGRKKIVRFADVLGLDLADVRTFLDEVPRVPNSAYDDLQDADFSLGASTSSNTTVLPSCPRPEKLLVPLFVQPGGCPDFLDRVREQQVCLENAVVSDPTLCTIAGTVRVRNLDFNKTVHVRYTMDEWRTFSDLQASYVQNSCDGFSDTFTFTLYAHTLEMGQRLEFAVRFQCHGSQYWDSNRGQNYAFQCLPPAGQSPFRSQPMSTCPDEQWASFY